MLLPESKHFTQTAPRARLTKRAMFYKNAKYQGRNHPFCARALWRVFSGRAQKLEFIAPGDGKLVSAGGERSNEVKLCENALLRVFFGRAAVLHAHQFPACLHQHCVCKTRAGVIAVSIFSRPPETHDGIIFITVTTMLMRCRV